VRARRQRRSRSVIAAREAGRLDGRVIVRATVTRLEPSGLLTICLCSECEARRMCPVPQGFVVRQQPVCCVSCAPVVLRPGHFICDLRIRCVENRNPSLRYGMWFATGVLAPALSEPKARSRAPARRLCDGVRRSRPTPCRQPEHRSRADEERSGRQLCQMRNCGQLLIGKVAARGRAVEPDKAGATNEELRGVFIRSFEQKGTNQTYPYCTHDAVF
jgi:hypothetical protein